MTSDIPPPVDDSHLFDDPAELARRHALEADDANNVLRHAWRMPWVNVDDEIARFERHSDLANCYRRMAERGERVPRF